MGESAIRILVKDPDLSTDQGSRAEDSCKLNEESNDSGDNDQVATICEFINNTMRSHRDHTFNHLFFNLSFVS